MALKGRMLRAGTAVAIGCVHAIACTGASPFFCTTDTQCNGADAGQCELNGYCSFPDGDCDSGRRYGSHAPPMLADQCVDPQDIGTGTSSTTSLETSMSASGSTQAGSTTNTSSVSTATTGSADTGSTGTPPDCAAPLLVEEFDDGEWQPEAWSVRNDAGLSLSVDGGQLRVAIDNPDVIGYAGLRSAQDFEIGAVMAQVELPAVLGPQWLEAETAFVLEDEEQQLRSAFAVYDGGLQAFITDPISGPSSVAFENYDPEAHRWLRIESGPNITSFFVSADGVTWEPFGEADTPTPDRPVQLAINAGRWDAVGDVPDEARFDHVLVCPL